VIWQKGSEVGRYRLERLIGEGGVGKVWLAHDVSLDRAVAIKVLSKTGASGAAAERFGREARVLAKVRHPSIVPIYDLGSEDDHLYIVTEFVEGSDLQTLISKGAINIGWGIHVAKQIAAAIKYAHEKGIIHRDIKPSNILIDAKDDRALLTDFGLAKGADALGTVTVVGAVVGTLAYMSPEQFTGQRSSEASDIYSLGATLYYLFTGSTPHDTTDIVRLVKNAATELPRKPQELRPEIPEGLSNTILRMLEPDPAKRLSSLEELEVALAETSADGDKASAKTSAAAGAAKAGSVAGAVATGAAAGAIGSAVSGASGAALVGSAAGPIGTVLGAVLGAGLGAYLAAKRKKMNKE
jgi:serine/threonine protein kinase